MNVTNMKSPRGNKVPNQFIITTKDGTYFQSYQSIIALIKNDGSVVLDDYYWDYSRTTGKYRNEFLMEGIAETRQKIASGEYQLTNLNA
ncbi:MAG TPA: hypothetical protein DCM40_07385 [Maribacter sp.]|nr:hypothetical protein [Maribacter sp.]